MWCSWYTWALQRWTLIADLYIAKFCREQRFSVRCPVQTCSRTRPATKQFSIGDKAAGALSWLLHPLLPYVFMAWYLIKHSDKLILRRVSNRTQCLVSLAYGGQAPSFSEDHGSVNMSARCRRPSSHCQFTLYNLMTYISVYRVCPQYLRRGKKKGQRCPCPLYEGI
jgi:hypothetical protein